MKVVILAGGYGTRLSEETDIRPKPMVEIGGKPILWHIMKIYSSQGFNDFIVCLGYKGEIIKKYFSDLYLQSSDFTLDTHSGEFTIHDNRRPSWRVSLIDTGINTLTGGRLLRVKNLINEDTFMMSYGDGVSNIELDKLLSFHKTHGRTATLTAVRPPARFGILDIKQTGQVRSFHEKPDGDGTWINGGFFVLNKNVFNYIGNDEPYFEDYPLQNLSKEGQLYAYKHNGFWRPMDTMSDKRLLENLWVKGQAEWRIWKD
ncbi:MAG: glucose-1-phosphate cytidylyltransferase [Candidatus Thermoplasmatota archaeon]|nr:glucose-1-phosphate cytidylyltransferase [Candidatus Thermoplasmatota archaeon]